MTRDAKALLRDLARHRRDEEALEMRRLNQQLVELNEAVELMHAEIERAELALRRRIADPFDRSAGEGYLASLRERLAGLRARREEIRVELAKQHDALEQRVIAHRQLDRVCERGEARALREAGRLDEIAGDQLASGSWYRARVSSGGAR